MAWNREEEYMERQKMKIIQEDKHKEGYTK